MSADGRVTAAALGLILLGLVSGGPAPAAEEPPPEAEFLEYLGSWEGTDEDWVLFERAATGAAGSDDAQRSDSDPAEESPESNDER